MSQLAVEKREKAKNAIIKSLREAKNCEVLGDIELQTALNNLESHKTDFSDAHTAVMAFCGSATMEFESSIPGPVEDAYDEAKSLLLSAIYNKKPSVSPGKTASTSFNANNESSPDSDRSMIAALQQQLMEMQQMMLTTQNRLLERPAIGQTITPRVKVPTFSGDLDQWTQYHDLFLSLIGNNNVLSGAEKLHHLKASLSGDAELLLRPFSITNGNFIEAWTTLKERYHNPRAIIAKHLDNILEMKALTHEDASQLRRLVNVANESVRSLRVLGEPIDHWNRFLVHVVSKKLDPITKRQWDLQVAKSGNAVITFAMFMDFIEIHCRANETNPVTKSTSSSAKTSSTSLKSTSSHHASTNSVSRPIIKCSMCLQSHCLQKCSNFKALDVTKRREIVKQKQLCYNCLSPHHGVNSCKSNFSCIQCKQRHHTTLHIASSVPDSTAAASPQSSGSTSTQSTATTTVSTFFANSVVHSKNIMLATAVANIPTSSGNQLVRMLIDSGSESSFVTEDLVQRLQLKKTRSKVSVTGLGGTSSGTVSGTTHFTVQARDNSYAMPMEALVLRKITNDLPSVTTETIDWSHIKGIQLADPTFFKPGPIDILLGADYYHEVIDGGVLRGLPGTPIAQQTKFGWILSGAVVAVPKQLNTTISLHAQVDLDNSLKRFWEIEEVSEKRHLTTEEEQCEQHFRQTHHRSPAGRYTVQLPLRQPIVALGDSKQIATIRLAQMERRFTSNQQLRIAYTAFMDEYRTLGHMTEVKAESPVSATYYLPHHAVVKPDSSTTKLRVVFDASCQSKSGKSLNDLLMVGPRLQEDLYDILLRFRKNKIAISADVTKMYRQIEVDPIHRNYQRILWRNSITEPIQEFQLNTVTYGTSAAPHLAVRTLQQLAIDEQSNFPAASEIVLNDFYVDDMLSGSDSVVGAIDIYQKTSEMLQRGGFQLRKWVSNSEQVLEKIPVSHRELTPEKELDQESVKTLGLRWNPSTDLFVFKCTLTQQTIISTKRTLLSDIAKLFDPIGLLAPVIIIGKVMFQQLWLRQLAWDDPLPADIAQSWTAYRESLRDVNQIAVNRWIYTECNSTIQLHGFADASERAYAAAVYMRSIDKDGQVKVALITAKSKVAPTKQQSLPRLELCAALLMAKLMCNVKRALHLETAVTYAWSDSTITLAWIKSQSTNWKTFIANRVSQIQQRIDPSYWNHVVSAENPADCATRGLSPSQLVSFHLWWNGPTWLQQPEIEWPISQIEQHTDLEIKTKSVSLITTSASNIFTPFSSWVKCKRVVAYCLRFIQNCKLRRQGLHRIGYLTAAELNIAANFWFRQAQEHHYHAEIAALTSNRNLPSKSKLLSLTPFCDKDGLLRVGGRLHNSALQFDRKHQIILPPKHLVTESLLREIHIQHLHAGNQLMLASLRIKYWIPGARSTIRHFIHQCVTCFKLRSAAQSQLMGSLPSTRVTPGRAFIQTGVDYAGPITLRVSYCRGPPKKYKAYIAVFVCMATRAIHLEVVSDMTSKSFIAAYHRFTSRRGRCTDLHSDNGTTFKGADNEMQIMLKQLQQQEHNNNIAQTLLSEGTNWHYIPPAAPHFGGLWEAGVKAMKHHLRRAMGASLLTYEEIQTLLCQIEACLNSRPICPMSDDPDDFETLTPGHFLIGQPITSVPEPDLTTVKNLSRYQQLQRQNQQFWKQWTSEYLTRLQQRPKWSIIDQNVKIDQLVIVRDDNQPPTKWKMARITAVYPGKDDLVRVVTIIDAERKLRKLPITKICVLPVGSKEDII